MAIKKSAKKVIRSSARKKVYNLRRKRTLRDTLKKLSKAKLEGEEAKLPELLPEAYKAIDKAAKRGIIKKNTAARRKSKVAKMVAAK